MGLQESKREQIIGSEELEKFGASIKNMDPPVRVVGIKRRKDTHNEQKGDSSSLVRIPSGLSLGTFAKLISVDGIVPNFLLALIHFTLILIVPIVTPLITFLAVCEMTVLQPDVYGRTVTFYDFYATNKLDPWWDNIPYFEQISYMHLHVLFHLFLAYFEVFSFYLTGYDN